MRPEWKAWWPTAAALLAIAVAVAAGFWSADSSRRLAMVEADLTALEEAGDRISERQALLDGNQPLFRAASAALAGAQLQSHILGLAEAAGVSVANTELLDPKDREIYLRAEMTGTEGNLVRMMIEIDRSMPFISIDELKMEAAEGAPETVSLSLMVSAGFSIGSP